MERRMKVAKKNASMYKRGKTKYLPDFEREANSQEKERLREKEKRGTSELTLEEKMRLEAL
jgi:hypothetical protein